MRFWLCRMLASLLLCGAFQLVMAKDDMHIIDDRSSGDYRATSGTAWRLITDGVMGGVSNGRLSVDVVDDQNCLRLEGEVKLENNGGFIQAALDLTQDTLIDIQSYAGVMLKVHGNSEQYNVHLRTRDNRLPWQSYRASFTAVPQWEMIYLPFEEFAPHRTETALAVDRLKRIGLVAIGREFSANLCIGTLALYR